MAALSAYYRGELRLAADQTRDLLTVTGECGTSWAARLGLPEDTPPAELAAVAGRHAAAWSAVLLDPTLDRATRSAARTIRRSYERLRQHITERAHMTEVVQHA